MRHLMMSSTHKSALSQALHRSHRLLAKAGSWTCAALCGALAFIASTGALASDHKSYPATSCKPVHGSNGILGPRPDGSVENDSTAFPLTVICPIVRDNTVTTGAWSVSVHVEDANNSGSVQCTGLSMGPFGGVVDDQASLPTDGPGTGAAFLTMALAQSAEAGYYAVRCVLPPMGANGRSAVNSYLVKEDAGSVGLTDRKSYTATYAEPLTSDLGPPPEIPEIRYDDLGGARTDNLATDDSWALPLVRDSVGPDTFWNLSRFRFNDSDADLAVTCWIFTYNENGDFAGAAASDGFQLVAPGPVTVDIEVHPNTQPYSGPISLFCTGLQADAHAVMYDISELTRR